jgi:hypothetical protein
MTEFARLPLWGLVSLTLGITACRNESPAFTEQDMASIAVSVAEGGYENEDRDNIFTIDDEASNESTNDSVDSVDEGGPSPKRKGPPETYAGYQDAEDESDEGSHPNRHSADQDAAPDSNSNSDSAPSNSGTAQSSSGSTPAYGISSDDSKAIAKACSQHFKGTASKIVVLSAGESAQTLTLGSQTVLAVRITGNQQALNLTLAEGQPLAGLCLVLRGHESSIQLTSGAAVKKMVYLAAGDQSSGSIQFSNGLEASYIELTGHEAQLDMLGVDDNVCKAARLRNHSAQIRCTP